MSASPDLGRIRLVLVEPQGPINVGSVARVMENFGFSDWFWVNPKAQIDGQSRAMASKAKRTLNNVRIVSTLEEALKGCQYAVGFTGLPEKRLQDRKPFDLALEDVLMTTEKNHLALIFGREDWGLDHYAMDRCRYITQIPTGESYPSLNLAQAVAIVCYHLFHLSRDAQRLRHLPPALPFEEAPCEERNELMQDIEESLLKTGFFEKDFSPVGMRNLRRFFERSRLTPKEVKILRGLCRHMRWLHSHVS